MLEFIAIDFRWAKLRFDHRLMALIPFGIILSRAFAAIAIETESPQVVQNCNTAF